MSKPTYAVIFEDIRNLIHNNSLKSGDPLPSENMLCKEYNTSRMTVRKAVTNLINFGYAYSIPGVGSFVSNADSDNYMLYFDELKSISGSSAQGEMIDIDVITPEIEILYNLNLQLDDRVILIRRLYKCDEITVAYDEKYIPYTPGIPLIEKEINYATFPDIVASKVSPFVIKKTIIINALKADEIVSGQLAVPAGDPVMRIEHYIYDDRYHVIGYSRIYYRSEYLSLKATSGYEG